MRDLALFRQVLSSGCAWRVPAERRRFVDISVAGASAGRLPWSTGVIFIRLGAAVFLCGSGTSTLAPNENKSHTQKTSARIVSVSIAPRLHASNKVADHFQAQHRDAH